MIGGQFDEKERGRLGLWAQQNWKGIFPFKPPTRRKMIRKEDTNDGCK